MRQQRKNGKAAHLVQTRLAIEQYNITVNDMSFDDITDLQTISDSISIPKLQELLVVSSCNEIGTRMYIAPISDRLFEHVHIVRCHSFRVCEDLRNTFRDSYFVNAQIWIRRYDRTT